MLQTIMEYKEEDLIQESKKLFAAGHPLHKGSAREIFIQKFLKDHLSELIGIGTGEIIDCNSIPGQKRNQIDIVLYHKNYPKILFGGNINCFLVESIVSIIEVKSSLKKKSDLFSIFDSTRNIKQLNRNVIIPKIIGYQPPSILSFIVAFDGPAKMSTLKNWIDEYIGIHNITYPLMPSTLRQRQRVICPIADMIVVLGKGFIHFDNLPATCITDQARNQHQNCRWISVQQEIGNLFYMFIQLTNLTSPLLQITPYISRVTVNVCFSP